MCTHSGHRAGMPVALFAHYLGTERTRSEQRWTSTPIRFSGSSRSAMRSIRRRSSPSPISAASSPMSTTSSARSRSSAAGSCSGRITESSTPATIRRSSSAISGGRSPRAGVWRGELRNRAKDGSIYWVDTTIVPLMNAAGKPQEYLAIRSDITLRKAMEQQLADQAALTQLGHLAAVVAHEVRNPLAGVKGSLQVLRGRVAIDPADIRIVDAMIARLNTLNSKVDDILRFARPRVPVLDAVELQAGDHRCERERRGGRGRRTSRNQRSGDDGDRPRGPGDASLGALESAVERLSVEFSRADRDLVCRSRRARARSTSPIAGQDSAIRIRNSCSRRFTRRRPAARASASPSCDACYHCKEGPSR